MDKSKSARNPHSTPVDVEAATPPMVAADVPALDKLPAFSADGSDGFLLAPEDVAEIDIDRESALPPRPRSRFLPYVAAVMAAATLLCAGAAVRVIVAKTSAPDGSLTAVAAAKETPHAPATPRISRE